VRAHLKKRSVKFETQGVHKDVRILSVLSGTHFSEGRKPLAWRTSHDDVGGERRKGAEISDVSRKKGRFGQIGLIRFGGGLVRFHGEDRSCSGESEAERKASGAGEKIYENGDVFRSFQKNSHGKILSHRQIEGQITDITQTSSGNECFQNIHLVFIRQRGHGGL
jgi:hypothetical protein